MLFERSREISKHVLEVNKDITFNKKISSPVVGKYDYNVKKIYSLGRFMSLQNYNLEEIDGDFTKNERFNQI